MSYTQNIIHQEECNYINPMISNAHELLNPCINKPGHNPSYKVEIEGDLCTGKPDPLSKYHNFYGDKVDISGPEQVMFTQQFSNNQNMVEKVRQIELVQRQQNLIDYLNNDNKQFQKSYEKYNEGLDKSSISSLLSKPHIYHESKPVYPTYVVPEVESEQPVHTDNGDTIEGFVPGDYVTDDGPGEKHIPRYSCPDEFELNKQTGMCEKKVVHGRTQVDISDYTDICHPNNYNGIDNMGHIMCSTELDIDGARLQLSTNITDQSSMNEIIRHYIR